MVVGRVKPLYISEWPRLEALVEAGAIGRLDFNYAVRRASNEAEAIVLATLLRSARDGHLCMEPKNVDLSLVGPLPGVVRKGHHFYLQTHWELEQEIAAQIRRITAASPPPVAIDLEGISLLPEQADAICQATTHALTLITGGPGTGKTYTAAHLLRQIGGQIGGKIAVAAPTGKAAGRLQESLGDEFEVTTLHSLLKVQRGRATHPHPLVADLILVDEASMIDVHMMERLLKSVRTGARLVLMGDADQLPPVEAGSLFADMLDSGLSSARLKTPVRAERQELIDMAAAVNGGLPVACHPLPTYDEMAAHFPHPWVAPNRVGTISFDHFRILSPLRKGVEQINRRLHDHFSALGGPGEVMVKPIMIVRNDRSLDLYNGDVGVMVCHSGDPRSDYALFGDRRLPALLLPPYELAYCLSVHKSQGSEYDKVWLLLPEGSQRFGREVVYTGITRARQQATIFCTPDRLNAIVTQKTDRCSQLARELLVNSGRCRS